MGDDGSILYEFDRTKGGEDNWGLVQKLALPLGIGMYAFDGQTPAISSVDSGPPAEERKVGLSFYSRNESGLWQQDQMFEWDYVPYRICDIAMEGNTLVGHTQDFETAGFWFERGGHPEQWTLKGVLQSSKDLDLRYGALALDRGRALVSYGYADVGGRNSQGMVLYYELSDPINAGHAGAWANFSTLGQGQLIDVDPENQFMFLSWFAYTDRFVVVRATGRSELIG